MKRITATLAVISTLGLGASPALALGTWSKPTHRTHPIVLRHAAFPFRSGLPVLKSSWSQPLA
jgi:hypothetical protein